MPIYNAPLQDIRFVLDDVLEVQSLASIPGYEEATTQSMDAILGTAAKFCEQTLFPLNQSGDAEGCSYENGAVRTPKGFKDAYKAFCDGGWTGLSCKKDYGGQGMPLLLNCVLGEMVSSANMSFGMYPGLTHCAYNALERHASDSIKNIYLPKLVCGKWTGAMCMTEPHCGSDLGLVQTKAESQQDGTYKITGGKIFISAGEHDLSENIVYLVLARMSGALPGIRGLSMFLVPKFLPDANGDPGERNSVSCGRVENKMGVHASATCAMNFDGAKGWLIGKAGKGLSAMFSMINEARLDVGLQGLGVAEVSYQSSVKYARERLQMRALNGAKYPDKTADPIIVHAEVRRNLLTMRSLIEGCRALCYWVAKEMDVSISHPDEKKRASAADFVAMMIPVVKAFTTDSASEIANIAVQIHGGHGYIKDNGIEQFVRDARITQIYEGTNGIQALDLVMRKMAEDYGRLMRQFFHPVSDFLAIEKDNGVLVEFLPGFASAFSKLQMSTLYIATRGVRNYDEAGVSAVEYLRLLALVAVGFMWLKMVKAASVKLLVSKDNRKFYEAKVKTARFYFTRILPQVNTLSRTIMSGPKMVMDFPEECF